MLSVVDLSAIETRELLLVPARLSLDDVRIVAVSQHDLALRGTYGLQGLR